MERRIIKKMSRGIRILRGLNTSMVFGLLSKEPQKRAIKKGKRA